MSDQTYWQRMHRRSLSRRALLGASAKAGVGAAGLALVGCGDDDDDSTAAQAPAPAAQAQAQAEPQAEAQAEAQAEQADAPAQAEEQAVAQAQEQATEQATEQAADDGITLGGTLNSTLSGLSSGNPPTLDPFGSLSFLAARPAGYHYSKLLMFAAGETLGYDDFATIVPDGVESLPEVVDPLTYNFTLRDNLAFHDIEPTNGRPVLTEDIVATEARFREISPTRANWITAVDNLEPTGERTFTLNLAIPFAPMTNLAASPEHLRIIPQEIVDDETVESRPVGSGPWIFEEFAPDVEIRWRRNPNWYREGVPYMDEVRASLVSDPSTLIANLATGALDASLLTGLPFEDVLKQQLPDLNYTIGGDNVFGGVYFDYSKEPWGDKRVRQALSMAMDRDGILDVTDQTGQRLWETAIPTIKPFSLDPNSDEFGPNAKYFQRNVEEARLLLDAAGLSDGITLRAITSPVYGPGFGQRMELVLSSIADAGFQGEIQNVEYGTYITTIYSGDFPDDASGIAIAPLKGTSTDPDDVFFTNYHPISARHNYGPGPGDISEDDALLALFDKQRTELDFDTRLEQVKEIQRVMAESMYIVPWPGQSAIQGVQPYMREYWPRGGYGAGTSYIANGWKDV